MSDSFRLDPREGSPSQITILRLPAVKRRTGLSRSSIYEQMKKGLFPQSISLGARAVGWVQSDIDEWLDNRIKISRDQADA